MESFGFWLEQLQQHRFYQQNLLNGKGSMPGQKQVKIKLALYFYCTGLGLCHLMKVFEFPFIPLYK
jgi:hypothetical protein